MEQPAVRSPEGVGRQGRRVPAAPVDVPEGYTVVSELGRGARTTVLEVSREGGRYAFKIDDMPAEDPEAALAGLRREAALVAGIDHPGVPRILETGRVGGRTYLVMDLVEGVHLGDLLRDGPLSPARTARVALDVAGALDAVHHVGLVHRDLKPQNLMVQADGGTRLIDYGLATRGMPTLEVEEGQDVTAVGTLAYAPPEQTGMLHRPVDARSDLYSLGVVLFECLTGELPFPTQDVGELLRMHAVTPPPDLSALVPDLPARLGGIVAELLAKDPDDRYQRGTDLLEDLHALAREERWEPHPDATTPALGTRGTPPLGRDREVDDLLARWRHCREGHPGAVIVRGPAGIGKTRVCAWVASRAGQEGALVMHGRSSRDDRLPLAVLRQAVEGHLDTVAALGPAGQEDARRRLQVAAGSSAPLLATLSPVLASALGVEAVPGEGDSTDQFATAVADFLLALAEAADGLVLHLDDAQWIDPASARVLEGFRRAQASGPLLLLATTRDDGEPDPRSGALDPLSTALDGFADLDVTLRPLSDAVAGDLIRAAMPGLGEVEGLADVLAVRSHGNPLLAHEFLRAVVDAGLLAPSWGTWTLDRGGLEALDLPQDALGLLLARIDRLGGEARSVLLAAAVIGTRFSVPLLAAVADTPAQDLQTVLAEATAERLVVLDENGRPSFVHDRVRESLVADVDPALLRRLHLRTAAALELAPRTPETVHALADHHIAASAELLAAGEFDGPDHGAQREAAFAACHAAGAAALADHASEQALAGLEFAAALRAPEDLPAGFLVDLATAYQRSRRFAEAVERFEAAREREPSPLVRAEILTELARIHNANWRPTLALRATAEGLRELGIRTPRTRLGAVLRTLRSLFAGLVVGTTGLGRGRVSGHRRERYRRAVHLRELASYAAVLDLDPVRMALEALSALFMVNRLGPGPEYAHVHGMLGQLFRITGRRGPAERLHRRAAAAARATGDPRLVAHVAILDAAAGYLGPEADMDGWVLAYERYGHRLDAGVAADTIGAAYLEESLRGRTHQARIWASRARAHPERIEIDSAMMVPGSVEVLGGHFAAGAAEHAAVDEAVGPVRERGLRLMFAMTKAFVLMEEREYGRPMDELLADVADLGVRPDRVIRPYLPLYLMLAQLQLGRLRRTPPEARAAQEHHARAALRTFAKVADSPLFVAHLRLAEAELQELGGEPERAMETLDRVGVLEPDAPLVAYQVALQRARCQAVLGRTGQARRDAATAALIASEQEWGHRARWVAEWFPAVPQASVRSTSFTRSTSAAVPGREGARLQALQDISRAASRELDPAQLSRIVLDRTIRIMGAERAFLFLTEGPDDVLVPYVGRDAVGTEITTPTAYGTTLVERVRLTREPLVVTGTDQGAALGSESVVIHGLRSILVAPLLLEDRLLGVVYLDSQVAKGIFTENDEGVLTAITTHIATSLETARAAQLRVSVESAHKQQRLAEQLGEAQRDLSASLDPQEVLLRLLRATARMLPGEPALLLTGSALTLGEGDGPVMVRLSRGGPERSVPEGEERERALRLLESAAGAAEDGSHLVVPVHPAHAEPAGVLLLRAGEGHAFGAGELEVARALAAQAATAYANAGLYAQVRELSVVDDLTGIANRRRLFEEAARELASARRHAAPLTAVMVDIDHFKRVNDKYGHGTGDDVIREVAARLRDAIRATDLVGRYGGEEFGLVLTETDDPATAGRRLLRAVTLSPIETRSGPLDVTVSVGAAQLRPEDTDPSQIFARADAALYRAKETGRNRVVVDPA